MANPEDLLPQQEAAQPTEPLEVVGTPETESSFEVIVGKLKTAWANQYEKYGVTEADFAVQSYEDAQTGETGQALIYTGVRGINLGDPNEPYDRRRNYNIIMADNNSHTVTIDGVQYDDRGLTESMHRAFINSAQEAGANPMPDSQTWSHLPGDKAGAVSCRIGSSFEGRPIADWYFRGNHYDYGLFRPAVELPNHPAEQLDDTSETEASLAEIDSPETETATLKEIAEQALLNYVNSLPGYNNKSRTVTVVSLEKYDPNRFPKQKRRRVIPKNRLHNEPTKINFDL